MNLNEIMKSWNEDGKIDEVLLDEASLKIPRLHQKYLTYKNEFFILQRKKQQELKKLKHLRSLYYSGKADPKEYEKNPFPYKILKNEINNWVEVDERVQKVETQLDYYSVILNSLDEILKQINQMSFNIKNAIEWRKFTGGV